MRRACPYRGENSGPGKERCGVGFIEYNGKLEVHNSLLNVVLHDKPEIKTRDEAISAE
jgi:hypothetical protein